MDENVNTEYTYVKERRKFGRECLFSFKNTLLFSEPTNQQNFREYILRNPTDHECLRTKQMALSEINTINKIYIDKGVNHTEGGWPKLIDPHQNVQRSIEYKNCILNDENCKIQLTKLAMDMKHTIDQNNAVNIYEHFFDRDGMNENKELINEEIFGATTIQCFSDTCNNNVMMTRSANHISFSPEDGHHMAIAYCNKNLQSGQLQEQDSFVWDIDNPQMPILTLKCESATCLKLEYNVRDTRLIVGGLNDGKLCVWDTRLNKHPPLLTTTEISHKECVASVLWNSSKTNTEFFSGSSDGQILWWDIRSFNQPLDKLLCDPIKTNEQLPSRSYGCSILEFEYTIPTRFMIGTQEGYLFSGNKKGKTPIEQIPYKIKCHTGTIYSLERNPAFVKNFLTIGDHIIKIWSEDCKESATIWSKEHNVQMTCGTWSRTRSSLMFVGRNDGIIDFWDILLNQMKPIINLRVSQTSICHNRSHKKGNLLATSDKNGNVFLIRLTDNMVRMEKNDRSLLSTMFEREIKREKILEGRVRELKLKERQMKEENETINSETKPTKGTIDGGGIVNAIVDIENVFYDAIDKDITDREIVLKKQKEQLQQEQERNERSDYTEIDSLSTDKSNKTDSDNTSCSAEEKDEDNRNTEFY